MQLPLARFEAASMPGSIIYIENNSASPIAGEAHATVHSLGYIQMSR